MSVVDHHSVCDWHLDQYPWECTCGATAPKASWHDRVAGDYERHANLESNTPVYRASNGRLLFQAKYLKELVGRVRFELTTIRLKVDVMYLKTLRTVRLLGVKRVLKTLSYFRPV